MKQRDLEKEFESVFEKYGKMLYKIAFLYLGNASDAEDALQEVFIKYLKADKAFKNDGHLKAWLIRVTQNKCKDYLKSPFRNSGSYDESIDFMHSDSDLSIDVIKKTVALPQKYKSVIILHYYYDYSVKEISTTLKISESAVKMRLKRGREILKMELEDYIQ